jgi:hypothetical protein
MVTFNAVASELVAKIMKVLPEHATIYQYSNIGLKPLDGFPPEEFLFKNKTLRGFHLSNYFESLTPQEIATIKQSVANDLAPGGKHINEIQVQGEFPLEKYEDARRVYLKGMVKGKVLLAP